MSLPNIGAYCAAKAAQWSLTNALRAELAPQGTRVSSLQVLAGLSAGVRGLYPQVA